MKKRVLAALLGAAIATSGLGALPGAAPVSAQEAPPPPPEVPATVQIEDPLNDANFLNDQDLYAEGVCDTPCEGDTTTTVDAGSASDFINVWFTNTADEVSVHLRTQLPAPATTTIYYRVAANPDEGDVRGCLNFRTIVPGREGNTGTNTSTYVGPAFAEVEDTCNGDGPVEAKVILYEETLEDGTGVTTITAPRSASPLLEAGGKIVAPYAIARVAVGAEGVDWFGLTGTQSDNTARGTDYALVEGDDKPECKKGEKLNPKTDKCEKVKKPKKPNCKKNEKYNRKTKKCEKAKKPKKPNCKKNEKYNRKTKKCEKKKKEPKGCPAYVPGDKGTDAETTVVTDAATEEKPVEVTLDLDPGFGQGTGLNATLDGVLTSQQSHAFQNVQVDSNNPEAGLFVELASPFPDDNDLYLFHSTGTEAAHAAGYYGPAQSPMPIYNSDDDGGHTEPNAEQLDGIRTADCGGYTVEAVGANSRGGDTTLRLWLGAPSDYEVPPPG